MNTNLLKWCQTNISIQIVKKKFNSPGDTWRNDYIITSRHRFDVIMSLYLRHMFAGDVTSRTEQRVSTFHGFIHTILNKQKKGYIYIAVKTKRRKSTLIHLFYILRFASHQSCTHSVTLLPATSRDTLSNMDADMTDFLGSGSCADLCNSRLGEHLTSHRIYWILHQNTSRIHR